MNGVFIDSNIFLKILEGDITTKNMLLKLNSEKKTIQKHNCIQRSPIRLSKVEHRKEEF
ncbi:hypothetical protein AIOGIFDO_01915 [Candidatus Methanoperedenaceae archaeon GB37]|nr:hypothetical protein AIOGIFDO_01915 [Candidatus Methanoperedenaceae archaeon GB37]